mgnify:CR=1 FL=1
MNNKQAKAMYRVSDVSGMILGGIGMVLLCVGEPIGLAFMGVAFVAIIVANRLYGKAHPETESKKDKYYSYKNQ